jgi:ABC-2 type transport system ATP-binding protein
MVIGHGRLLYDGQLEALKTRYAPTRRIRAELERPVEAFYLPVQKPSKPRVKPGRFFSTPLRPLPMKMVERLAGRLPIRDIVIEETDIDEIIATMYKEMGL